MTEKRDMTRPTVVLRVSREYKDPHETDIDYCYDPAELMDKAIAMSCGCEYQVEGLFLPAGVCLNKIETPQWTSMIYTVEDVEYTDFVHLKDDSDIWVDDTTGAEYEDKEDVAKVFTREDCGGDVALLIGQLIRAIQTIVGKDE